MQREPVVIVGCQCQMEGCLPSGELFPAPLELALA